MKKMRFMILVIFMLSVSIFAFVSQGEELVVTSTVEHNNEDLAEVPVMIEAINAKSVATLAREMTIIQHEIEETRFNEVEKLVGIYEEKAIAEEIVLAEEQALSEKVQFIVDTTPLDAKTAQVIIEYSERYDIRTSLILGVMDLESNFNQYLVGSSDDRGYMQVIPGTEKWLVSKYGEELGISYDPSRIFEAEYNIPLAVKYLSVLKLEFGENFTKVLTAYNRGSGGLRKWYAEHGTYETAYSRVVLKRELKYLEIN